MGGKNPVFELKNFLPELTKTLTTEAMLHGRKFIDNLFTKFFILALIIISFVVFIETSIVIIRIAGGVWRNGNINLKSLAYNIIALFYIFFIFTPSAEYLHNIISPVFFLYILLICMCSDIGGYILGKTIG